jgi:hypothetical protein
MQFLYQHYVGWRCIWLSGLGGSYGELDFLGRAFGKAIGWAVVFDIVFVSLVFLFRPAE